MPRDRANIRTNIWADTNWRSLSKGAQHLYLLLLSHPDLNYAGVCDWRPGRIARMTDGQTIESVRRDADELERAAFVLRDDETEEICVRSFVKHDGLMKQPLLGVSMANAYAGVASPQIRRVIAWEVQKLNRREPDLAAWQKPAVQTVLAEPAFDLTKTHTRDSDDDRLDALGLGLGPELTPGLTPSPDRGQAVATTTATPTATEEPLLPPQADDGYVLIPSNWKPHRRHRDKATSLNFDADREAARFRDHATRNQRRLKGDKGWDTGFTNWLRKQAEFAQKRTTTPPASLPRAPKQTAAEAALENFNRKYGDTTHEPHGDRSAIGAGRSDRLTDGH